MELTHFLANGMPIPFLLVPHTTNNTRTYTTKGKKEKRAMLEGGKGSGSQVERKRERYKRRLSPPGQRRRQRRACGGPLLLW